MSFYEEISPYYDDIFPVDDAEMAFASGKVAGKERLLDMGCGTGNKTVFFAQKVTQVTAFDLDPAMIDEARMHNVRPNIRYEVADITRIDEVFAGQRFDSALCLGNTLVHITDPDGIRSTLAKMHALLEKGSPLLIQILNYDRILDRDLLTLPLLENDRITFSRKYVEDGNLLRFVTSLTVTETGQAFNNDIPLYPLRKNELADALTQAGFTNPTWYGGYDGSPHTEDSFVTIVACMA